MRRFVMLSSVVALIATASPVRADILITGSTINFTNEGIYTFDFTATAVGQNYTIVGFTIPLLNVGGATPLPEIPDTSLSDIAFTPNPLLELPLASSDFTLGGFGFSVSAQDNNDSPLVINAGESALLFSIPMNVLAPGDVLTENLPLASLQTLTPPIGQPAIQVSGIGPAVAAAIPEPGSPTALALACVVVRSVTRRRRAASE